MTGETDGLRGEILETLRRAAAIARRVAPPGGPVDRAIDAAGAAAGRIGPDVYVIGGEGHGKSTLVNALLNVRPVPVSSNYPGTAAPVVVSWSPSARPDYAVRLRGGRGPVGGLDAAGFAEYLLQEKNPDNAKGVELGEIRVDDPALRSGARLVDLPGVAGVSDAVAAETATFLGGRFGIAVAVLRARQIAPLLDLLRGLPPGALEVQVVVCNLDTGELDVEDVRTEVRRWSEAIAGALSVAAPGLGPERVFALHLPSIRGLRPADNRRVTDPAHDQEIERFAARVRPFLDGSDRRVRLADAARQAAAAVALVGERYEALAATARGLITRRPDALASARATVDHVEARARECWRASLSEPGRASWRAACAAAALDAVETARGRIAAEAAPPAPRSTPQGSSSSPPPTPRLSTTASWRAGTGRAGLPGGFWPEAVKEYTRELHVAYEAALAEADCILPVDPGDGDGPGPSAVRFDSLMPFQPTSAEFCGFGEFFDDRKTAHRTIEHVEAQLRLADGRAGGPEDRRFAQGLDRVVEAYQARLDARLARLRDTVMRPEGWLGELSRAEDEARSHASTLAQDARRLAQLAPQAATAEEGAPDPRLAAGGGGARSASSNRSRRPSLPAPPRRGQTPIWVTPRTRAKFRPLAATADQHHMACSARSRR